MLKIDQNIDKAVLRMRGLNDLDVMRTFLQCCVKEVIKKCASLLVNIGKMMTAILRPLKFQFQVVLASKKLQKTKAFLL